MGTKKKVKPPRPDYRPRMTQKDFEVETLGKCPYKNPLQLPREYLSVKRDLHILYNNAVLHDEKLTPKKLHYFEAARPTEKIHFDPKKINVGIVSCGGLCPGINDVIRSITFTAMAYGVKNIYGFRYGYQGLTSAYNHEAVILNFDRIENIHDIGGTVLATSRGPQSIQDIVDTLVKFNISILFVIGGDGTQHGSMEIAKEIKHRKLDISIIGIPKTIDNDINFIHRSFGFYTAVEEAREAIQAARAEAKGARNGIGIVKLMGRHSGFIAANATLASSSVNICLIPEIPIDLDELFMKIEKRLALKPYVVIVIAEGAGQDLLKQKGHVEHDASGNVKLKDVGIFLKDKISEYLNEKNIEHTVKYIDPSYMIRSTVANASDASFCLQLGKYAVHAGMAGKTNVLIGHWNQHFTLCPIKLAVSGRKLVDPNSSLWLAIKEITL
ncbi:MAG: ATP-dependent 6-phosphofructokinase [Pseudomonadota bacterium]